ncbi:MAG: hypothetical protein QOE36_49, partial [Gaiellaceae bacterium]|nr:hypothetical protein [Gaiellaceae bacterium]
MLYQLSYVRAASGYRALLLT